MCVNHLPLMTATNLASVKFEIVIRESESSDFWFRDKKFSSVKDLLDFLAAENMETCKRYKNKYGISAPYLLTQNQLVYCATISTCIRTHNKVGYSLFLFEEDKKLPERIVNRKVPIFRCIDIEPRELFGIKVLVKLHNAIMANCVIRPAYFTNNRNRYIVKIDGQLHEAEVKSFGGASDFHLHFARRDDRTFFGYCNLKTNDYQRAGSPMLHMVDDVVPWDYKENILRIMDVINAVRCADFLLFAIDDNVIVCGSLRFEITRTHTGKWYLKGEAEDFTKAFNCSSLGKIREIAAKLFGRRMMGIFPECNTKEELLTLIEKIKK